MCIYTSESKFPPTFTVIWGMWCLLDIAYAVVGYSTKDDVCQSPNFPFDLSFWLSTLGLIGLVVNALQITVEVNPSHVSKKLAIFLRVIMALACLSWIVTGIIYVAGVGQECYIKPLFILAVTGLVFMFIKTIALHFSTNYSFRRASRVTIV